LFSILLELPIRHSFRDIIEYNINLIDMCGSWLRKGKFDLVSLNNLLLPTRLHFWRKITCFIWRFILLRIVIIEVKIFSYLKLSVVDLAGKLLLNLWLVINRLKIILNRWLYKFLLWKTNIPFIFLHLWQLLERRS